jgi:hypothetical protein
MDQKRREPTPEEVDVHMERLKANPRFRVVDPLTHQQHTAELEADPRFVRVRTGAAFIIGGQSPRPPSRKAEQAVN